MNWKDFRSKCKQLNLNVGKTWVNVGNRDYTKHHKIVEVYDEGYDRDDIAVNVSYADMYKIIIIRRHADEMEQQLLRR